MGTIELHLSDTRCIVRMIEEQGINSLVTVSQYTDGPLARGMAFLNSYYTMFIRAIDIVRPHLVAPSGSFVALHDVGQGRFETVNTCLRTSGGALTAVKSQSH